MSEEDEYREPCKSVSVSHGVVFLAEQSQSERVRIERAIAAERQRIYREVVGPLVEALASAVSILGVAVEANVTGAHTIRERLRAAIAAARKAMENKP